MTKIYLCIILNHLTNYEWNAGALGELLLYSLHEQICQFLWQNIILTSWHVLLLLLLMSYFEIVRESQEVAEMVEKPHVSAT